MRPCLALLLVPCLAGRAVADEEPWYPAGPDCVTAAASDQARRALAAYWFEQGTAQVEAETFAEAMRSYGCSQRIIPHPHTLYNLARAAEWAGEFDVALRALREYVAAAPDDESRAAAEDLALRVAAAAELRERPPPEPPPPEPPPSDRGVDLRKAFGWAAVGLAGAAGAAGAVTGGLAAREHAAIEDAADGTPWTEIAAHEDRRDILLIAMGATLGAAVAAAVAGTALLLLDDLDDAPQPITVAPVATADAAGMVLTWNF